MTAVFQIVFPWTSSRSKIGDIMTILYCLASWNLFSENFIFVKHALNYSPLLKSLSLGRILHPPHTHTKDIFLEYRKQMAYLNQTTVLVLTLWLLFTTIIITHKIVQNVLWVSVSHLFQIEIFSYIHTIISINNKRLLDIQHLLFYGVYVNVRRSTL